MQSQEQSKCNMNHLNHSMTPYTDIITISICTDCAIHIHPDLVSLILNTNHRKLLSTNSSNSNTTTSPSSPSSSARDIWNYIAIALGSCIALCVMSLCVYYRIKSGEEFQRKASIYVIDKPSSVHSESNHQIQMQRAPSILKEKSNNLLYHDEDEKDDIEIAFETDEVILPKKGNKNQMNGNKLLFETDEVIVPKKGNKNKKDYTNEVNYAMVKSWLEETVQLPQYYEYFILNGFESMEMVYRITHKETLKYIGVDLRGHQTKIMADINRGRLDPISHFNEIQKQWLRKEERQLKLQKKDDIQLQLEIDIKRKHLRHIKANLNKDLLLSIPRPVPLSKELKRKEREKKQDIEVKQMEVSEDNDENKDFCDGDDMAQCTAVHRVILFMKIYEDWNFEQNNYGDLKYEVFAQKFTKFDVMNVINDYHHYRDNHGMRLKSFYYLYRQIMKRMNHGECDRDHDGENHQRVIEERDVNISMDDGVKLEILTSIHCDIMHHETDMGIHIDPNQKQKANIEIIRIIEPEPVPEYDDENETKVPIKLAPKRTSNLKKKHGLNVKKRSKHVRECSKFVSHIAQQRSSHKIKGILLLNNINQAVSVGVNKQVDRPRHSSKATFESEIDYDDYDSDEDDDKDDDDEHRLPSYDFGKRWYYWKHYKAIKHKDYIEAKYNSLKEELLQNKIYRITEKFDWNSVYNKANVYMRCLRAKALKASGELVYFYYGPSHIGDRIQVEHIIAMLFYCNYDNLQTHFGETFRLVQADDTWNRVKKRNTEFVHWSRLLREAVELYGSEMRQYPEMKLHHGLNCELVFDSINCKFCAPTSMTTAHSVAESFSRGFGLILTLSMYDSSLRFFDCSWLSNYPSEEEKLFVGGYAFIKLSSIILCRLGHNYKHYITAIGIIQNMFDARHNPSGANIDAETVMAVTNLLESKIRQYDNDHEDNKSALNEYEQFMDERRDVVPPIRYFKPKAKGNGNNNNMNKIPEYIEQLFAYFCKNWDKTIRIDIAKFKKNTEYNIFRDLIIDNDRASQGEDSYPVKIDVICKIFENINCIEIVNGFKFTHHTLDKLLRLLSKDEKSNVFSNLNEIKIEIQSFNTNIKEVKSLLNSFEDQFQTENWKVSLLKHEYIQHSQYVIFVKDVPLDTAR